MKTSVIARKFGAWCHGKKYLNPREAYKAEIINQIHAEFDTINRQRRALLEALFDKLESSLETHKFFHEFVPNTDTLQTKFRLYNSTIPFNGNRNN